MGLGSHHKKSGQSEALEAKHRRRRVVLGDEMDGVVSDRRPSKKMRPTDDLMFDDPGIPLLERDVNRCRIGKNSPRFRNESVGMPCSWDGFRKLDPALPRVGLWFPLGSGFKHCS
jgi:hypothetical protein